MKQFLKRLTSRKFLLAVAACLVFYANKEYTQLLATILTYIGVEGAIDVTQARNKPQAPITAGVVSDPNTLFLPTDDEDEPNKDVIQPGLH